MIRPNIEEVPHTSICEVSTICGLLRGTTDGIIYEYLREERICERWTPHPLTKEQKKQRVVRSKKLLGMSGSDGTKRVCDIVTGEENWIYLNGIPNKRSH